MNTYALGSLIRVSGNFTDEAGAPTDPTTVRCAVLGPGASAPTVRTFGQDSAIVRDAAGQYHLDVDGSAVGEWHYRWYSSGTGQAAAESYFVVAPSRFGGVA